MQVLGLMLALSLASATHAGDDVGTSGSEQGPAPPDSTFTVATVGELQDQLLSTTFLDSESLVQVYSDFDAMQSDFSSGAAVPVENPNTTTFASVLVVSNVTSSPDTGEELAGRTQLYYNCTSTPFIWNLLDDSNVVALVAFQSSLQDETPHAQGPEFSSSSTDGSSASASDSHQSFDSSASGSTSGLSADESVDADAYTTVVATATLAIANCNLQRNYSAQQILLGNASFGEDFVNATTYFRVITSSQLEPAAGDNGGCHVHMELARARLQDIYPECKVKFYSTDLDALLKSQGTVATRSDLSGEEKHESTRDRNRRLGASSYGFIKHSACEYECGNLGAEMDQCYSITKESFPCTLALYAMNRFCNYECGDKPPFADSILFSKCYHCRTTLFPCEDYEFSYLTQCCTLYNCDRVDESGDVAPKALTWNLLADRKTVANDEVVIYSEGDCSNVLDLTSDCCQLSCLDCFANLTISSLFADVDASLTDVGVDAEVVLRGNIDTTLKLFAPQGCDFEYTRSLVYVSLAIPISTMLSLSIDFKLRVIARAWIKPRDSTTVFGVTSTIERLSAGFKDSTHKFRHVQISSRMHQNLKEAALDATASLSLVPELTATLKLLNDYASVGVHAQLEAYAELSASVAFLEPMPPLLTRAYNPSSLLRMGDCRYPHFMTYEVVAGVTNIAINFPVTVLKFTPFNPSFTLPSLRKSVISGCVTTAYTTELVLSLAASAVGKWAKSHELKLLAAVLRVLNFTDIDKNSLELRGASDSDSRMFLKIQVPPSMVDEYSTASTFLEECTSRAQTSSFQSQISSAVGMQVAATCLTGLWGPSCSFRCPLGSCEYGSCNSVDGKMIECQVCLNGFWGEWCTETCGSAGCIKPNCDRETGEIHYCTSCAAGLWGEMCNSTCAITNSHCASSAAATCDRDSGELESCGGSCQDGFTGDLCSTPVPATSAPTPSTNAPTNAPTTATPVGVGGFLSGSVGLHATSASWRIAWVVLMSVVGLTSTMARA